ncbi:hypothetical protein NLJ89_g488 [Agrocybe chaxingu]|uniref:DUF6697 domain-containing protein n=1 Tax=Agrocybe chaxingu TaxID=84603 RepID=A0A9W8N1S6_9AGAR|nr:hypothetical protein NLJ89_g488 [Agrocybe chaxingu]
MEDDLTTTEPPKAESNKEVVDVKANKLKAKKEVVSLDPTSILCHADAPLRTKVKKLEMQLSVDIQAERLRRVNADEPYPVKLDKVLTEFTVSRDVMSKFYGGGNVQTFPRIARHRYEQHGLEFCYLHRAYEPNSPPLPGYHGLFLGSYGGENIPGVQTV